ncbi:Maf family nucleotide pyrophosphatase [soil metagenome]
MSVTLVLASGSPQRADLLGTLGVEFSIEVPVVDEARLPGEPPHTYVERLARSKAEMVARPGVVAVGADTAVVHEGQVLGKPLHPAEAIATLRRLAGEVHHVVTGVAVSAHVEGGLVTESVVESATVRMAPMTDTEIAAYVATGEPLDKAGSYALQGRGGVLVQSVDGHPTTVVGLPVPVVVRLLARRGIVVLG